MTPLVSIVTDTSGFQGIIRCSHRKRAIPPVFMEVDILHWYHTGVCWSCRHFLILQTQPKGTQGHFGTSADPKF